MRPGHQRARLDAALAAVEGSLGVVLCLDEVVNFSLDVRRVDILSRMGQRQASHRGCGQGRDHAERNANHLVGLVWNTKYARIG